MDTFFSEFTSGCIAGFDTETTGLHILRDKPFVFSCGYYNPDTLELSVASLETGSNRAIIFIDQFFSRCKSYTASANTTFDMHMLANIGYMISENIKLTDIQFYIRWGSDNIQEKFGGAPLKLKQFARRYIDRTAGESEAVLKKERSQLKRKHKREIGYDELNRKNMLYYATEDIVLTLEVFYLMYPVVVARNNMFAVNLEEQLLWPLFEMERVGFDVDRNYMELSKVRTQVYMKQMKVKLKELAGQEVNVGQHALIKKILTEKFDLNIEGTGKDVLELIVSDLHRTDPNNPVVEFIDIVQRLRTIEKWYSTYILRWLNDIHEGKVYTQIHSVGAVSGRVTSDFQQFPKEGLFTDDGQELFIPRKMVCCPKGEYDALVYLDYSQIELRIQALYTMLVLSPDYNLCRAYMPYQCTNKNGDWYNPLTHKHLWNSGDWYNTDGTPWIPTDVHGATTCHAFDITESDPTYKKLRSVGKRVNFAKNYGASRKQIMRMFPDFSPEQITKIDDAYYKAFPGVKAYHQYCMTMADTHACVTNLFGVKYYNVSGHNLKNMLIQGSAATLLKLKIIEIYKYRKQNNIKSKFQMNIHDENSFVKHSKDSMNVFLEIKRIMEDWEDSLIPIVADVEISRTTWFDKEEWHG